jgi:hypothetical protein
MVPNNVPDMLWHMLLNKSALLIWLALHLNQRLREVARGPAIGPPPI